MTHHEPSIVGKQAFGRISWPMSKRAHRHASLAFRLRRILVAFETTVCAQQTAILRLGKVSIQSRRKNLRGQDSFRFLSCAIRKASIEKSANFPTENGHPICYCTGGYIVLWQSDQALSLPAKRRRRYRYAQQSRVLSILSLSAK